MNKSVILVIFIIVGFTFTPFSQVGVKVGGSLGSPKSIDNKDFSYLGFYVGFPYNFTEKFRGELLFEGLFNSSTTTSGKPVGNVKNTYGIMPLTIGGDYSFFQDIIRPYIGLNFGLYMLTSNVGGYKATPLTKFGLYPKAGFNFEVSKQIFIDLGLKYHFIFMGSNQSNKKSVTEIVGANLGLVFNIK